MAAPAFGSDAEGPLRLDDAIPSPRISLTANHRSRFEFLSDQFRLGQQGDDQAFVMRTLLHGTLQPLEGITLGAELQDSRAFTSDGTLLTTTTVNAAELLRAYVDVHHDLLGGNLRLTGGRITMDVGSRRFVARNRFRNTINGFTGLDAEWRSPGDDRTVLRAFWVLPVQRLPGAAQQRRLRDNAVEFDEEGLDVQLWGVFLAHQLANGLELEHYTFGLHEDDGPRRPTRDRGLYTTGGRLLRPAAKSTIDYQIEFALQWGRSRATALPADVRSLDHFAHFEHVEVGYTFDAPWRPRVALEYDYASGDEKSGDGKNGRFDTLFGARRFDFGPTGIYGPFARSNINTPGVRVQLRPQEQVTGFVAYRAYWLASDRDRWTTTGLVDPTGNSGSFLGHQLEFRIRWRPLPGNLQLEMGYAHLFDGEFIQQAPNSPSQGDSNYVYTQAVLRF